MIGPVFMEAGEGVSCETERECTRTGNSPFVPLEFSFVG